MACQLTEAQKYQSRLGLDFCYYSVFSEYVDY